MPQWLRKTKIVKKVNKMLVNHLGLTLAKEDLQNVVDLMEPYGQISNGIELLSPPHDVRNYHLHNVYYVVNFHCTVSSSVITDFLLTSFN